ncbi:MAG: hypothetical protein WCB27_11855 [Thermoguttaceae bacterium]|jgi:hypothetical protein
MGRKTNLSIISLLFGSGLAFIAGCGGHRGHPYALRIDAEAAGRAAIAEYDTNGDGRISGAELDNCPGVKAAINQIDPSGNGDVTSDKITARIKVWQDSKLGRMAVQRRVVHNGRPVPNAEVKFVPEKFLGPIVPTASGTTDKKGVAIMSYSRSGREPPGVVPGFYRIEITKRGANIPAEYNTKTTLGLEIAVDADWIKKFGGKPIEFDLKY